MIETVIVLIISAIVVFVVVNKKPGDGRRGRVGRANAFAPWPNTEIPPALGVPYGHPARSAAERLESALGLDFESRVKDRVMKEYPKMTDKEWNWTWFELKRYFLMCGILRSVPMYSGQVDAAWHEMLMFTREYEQFCSRFCGEMIHHAPHAAGEQPLPDERAWFDWVYGELFTGTPASGRVWGAFFRTQMSEQKLTELAHLSEASLRMQWFNKKAAAFNNDLSVTADYLIERAKSQLTAARNNGSWSERGDAPAERTFGYDPVMGATGMLSGLLVFHSISNPNEFARQMDLAQTEAERKAYGSGETSYGCASSSDNSRHDSNGDDGGGSSDGSSCGSGGGDSGGSSCGGGCSS